MGDNSVLYANLITALVGTRNAAWRSRCRSALELIPNIAAILFRVGVVGMSVSGLRYCVVTEERVGLLPVTVTVTAPDRDGAVD
jgi:hypothetical protein